jgi:aconitase B
MRSRSPAESLGVEAVTATVVGSGVNSQILSAWWEAETRLPSVCPTRIACTCGGGRLAQIVCRKSSVTSGAKPLRCQRKCEVFLSPISS